MHTLMILVLGFALLTVSLIVGYHLLGGVAKGARYFIPFWLLCAIVNMWVGLGHGYSFMAELGVLLLVFLIPAIVAVVVSKRYPDSHA